MPPLGEQRGNCGLPGILEKCRLAIRSCCSDARLDLLDDIRLELLHEELPGILPIRGKFVCFDTHELAIHEILDELLELPVTCWVMHPLDIQDIVMQCHEEAFGEMQAESMHILLMKGRNLCRRSTELINNI